MPDPIINDATAKAIAAVSTDPNKTPEQAKNDASNDAIVTNLAKSFRNDYASGVGAQDSVSGFSRPDASKYDVGYTGQQGDIGKFRAGQQSGWDQFGNRSATAVPNIALGIVELGGHIIDTPEQVWGLITGGQGFDGQPNDFDNAISKWARETSEGVGSHFRNYHKDPDKIFDFSDPASYIDAGFDTAESIIEFMATGFGTAKAIGAASKLIGAGAKGMMSMDMLGAGIKAAEKAGKLVNSAVTSSSVASLNAAQTYTSIREHILTTKKDDGTAYTEEEASAIAAQNAASTYRTTLLTATALNYTSLAPFATKAPKRIKLSGKSKKVSSQIKELDEILKNDKALVNGDVSQRWYRKYLGSYGGEALQEGTEEVTENLASEFSIMDAKRQAGEDPEAFDFFSPENALAFTLGALGGGMAKGIGSAYKSLTNDGNEFEQFVQVQRDALAAHENLSNHIQDLKNQDVSELSPEDYRDTVNKINAAEMMLVENAIVKGLDDGTIAMMDMDIDNLLNNEDNENIDKERLTLLKGTIAKHRKMVEKMSSDPKDANIQRGIISSSIRKDLAAGTIQNLSADYDSYIQDSPFINTDDHVLADKVNKLQAYENAEKRGDLNEQQIREKELIKAELAEMESSEALRNNLTNDHLVGLAESMIAFQGMEYKAEEDYNKLSNSDTAEGHYDKLLEQEIKDQQEMALAVEAEQNITAAQEIVQSSESIQDIDAAINRAKGSVNSKYITKDPAKKAALEATLEAIETQANIRKDIIRNDNKIKDNVNNADPKIKDVASKMATEIELTPSEMEFAEQNNEEITEMADAIKYLAAKEKAKADAERAAAEETVDNDLKETEVKAADLAPPDHLADVDLKNPISSDTPAGDKASTEETPTEENPADTKETESKKEVKEAITEKPEAAKTPTKITTDMKFELVLLGYTSDQISRLKPEHAAYIISNQIKAQKKKGDGSQPKNTAPAKGPSISDTKNGETPIGSGEFVAFQRQIKYYFFTDKDGKKISNDHKDDAKQIEAAKKYLQELLSEERPNAWDLKKIELLTAELWKVEHMNQRRVYLPKLTDGQSGGRGIQFEINDDLYYMDGNEKVTVPVTEIFESEGDNLLINTPNVLAGQTLEIAYDPDWKFFQQEGAEPIMIYRTDGKGNRISSKPIAELPFKNVQPGSIEHQIRQAIVANKNRTFTAVIGSKNNGDLITERKANGERATNSITNADNSPFELTIGIVGSEGEFETPNRVPDRYTDSENEAIESFNKQTVKKGANPNNSNGQTNSTGSTFVLMTGADGKLMPAHISPKRMSPEVIDVLTAPTTDKSQRGNIAQLLASGVGKDTGSSSPGAMNLKKLMIVSSKNFTEMNGFMRSSHNIDTRRFAVTANSLFWRVDKNTWIKVDYKLEWTAKDGKKGVSNPLDQMLNGKKFSYKKYVFDSGTGNYKETKNEDNTTYLSVTPGSEAANALTQSLKDTLGSTSYNIHSKSINDPNPFTDAWGVDMGMSYNEYLEKNVAVTDVTSADVKFSQSGIHVRLDNDIESTNPVTDEVTEQAPEPENVRTSMEEEVEELEKDGQEIPTKENPVPDDAGTKPMSIDELAAAMMNDNDFKTRSVDLGRGMKRMTKQEVDWMYDQVGPGSVNLIKGVDRVWTIGGREAFGWYHNSMITLAEEAETGSAYHESFHFVFNMALNASQRKRLLNDAKRQYGVKTDLEAEEALAEDFRAYMLERNKQERRPAITRFFDSIIQYIENFLGFSTNRDSVTVAKELPALFQDIASGKWKQIYKDQFGKQIQPKTPLYLEVGNMSYKDQDQLLESVSSEVVYKALEYADKHETFADLISDRKRLQGMINIVHHRLKEKVAENQSKVNRITKKFNKTGNPLTKNEASIIHSTNTMNDALANWTLTEDQSNELNPPATFEIELLKRMTRWGFQVSLTTELLDDTKEKPADPLNEDGIKIAEDTDDTSNPENSDEETDGEKGAQEHLYNQDGLLKDPKKSMTSELLRKISMIPVYDLKNGKLQSLTDEEIDALPDHLKGMKYKTKTNLFGSPMLHDMNQAFANIKQILADKPVDELMNTIKTEAKKGNPLFIALNLEMENEISQDSQSSKRFEGFISSFMSVFNNATYDLVTIKSGKVGANGIPELMFTSRTAAHNVVNSMWKNDAFSMGLVNEKGESNTKKWTKIKEQFDKDTEFLGKVPPADDMAYPIWETAAFDIAQRYLSKIGLEVEGSMLADMLEENNTSIEKIIKGKYRPSIEAILNRGVSEDQDPFSKEALMTIFSKSVAKASDDVAGGAVFNNGKQYHTINMPSMITDFFNDIKGKSGTLLDEMAKDAFYTPSPGAISEGGNPGLTNMFLQYLNDPKNLNDTKVAQLLDFKDGKDGKEYINTNFEQSFLQKVIAGSYSSEHGYFSVGTLSDKLKSLAIRLPVSSSIADAKAKYLEALRRTIYQEASRIDKYNKSPEFKKRYTKLGKEFIYLQELNSPEFAGVMSSILAGDMSTSEFNDLITNKVMPKLQQRIDAEINGQLEKLVHHGMLKKNFQSQAAADQAGGELYTLSDSAQKNLSLESKEGLDLITKFIIEDTMWKMETSKVLMGDQAKYKDYWTYFKRMYQIVTPGRKAFVEPSLQNASHKVTMSRLNIKTPHSFLGLDDLTKMTDNILTDEKDRDKANRYLKEIFENREKDGQPLSDKQLLKIVQSISKKGGKRGPRIANAVYTAYSYRSNNRGDAATFVSIEFFRDQKKGLGQWNKHYEWIYQKAWKKAITVEQATDRMTKEEQSFYKNLETKLTADVLKPFYYGQRLESIQDTYKDPKTGKQMPVSYDNMLQEQYKESMAPILPIWGKQISGFDWMLKQFDKGIDAVSTEDTVKVGNFDNIELGANDDIVAANRRDGIPTKNLRYPQVPAKMKDHSIAGTQLQKIIMSNLDFASDKKYMVGGKEMSARELTELYNDTFSKKIEQSFEKVREELSLSSIDPTADLSEMSTEDQLRFTTKLRNIISDSVVSQNKSENFIEALKIIKNDKGNYEYDLGLSFDAYSRTYQNMITSLVGSNILKQEVPGGAMVNMADLSVKTDDQLKFLRIDPKTGRTLPAEIAMPHVQSKKIGVGWGIKSIVEGKEGLPTVDEKGDVIYENLTKKQKEMMNIVVYRIPTQMKSSALPTIIKRILPDSDGAKIMIPGEMTTQAGLDFDFDKSFIMMKEYVKDAKEGETEAESLDNTIFDIHWSVLTDPSHFGELVAPVSSKTHDMLIDEFSKTMPSNAVEGIDTSNVFSSITNIEMEGLAKYSHIMRGTFSKFAGGHNVMTSVRLMMETDPNGNLGMDHWIKTSKPVLISSGRTDYKYNEFGRQEDSTGILISDNHSENLNSALDSQADPKLGKLNTSVFNSFATGYMLDVGVPEATVKRFMNSNVLKEMSKKYFQLGGTPDVMYDAAKAVMVDAGLESKYFSAMKVRKGKKYKPTYLNESHFVGRQEANTEIKILLDFLDYNGAGNSVSKLNDMLSPDTQKISDAAGIRGWDNKRKALMDSKSIAVNPDLFSSERSPIKKIATFHEKGIDFQKSFVSNLFPYFSTFYDSTIENILVSQNSATTSDWATLDKLHSAIDNASLALTAQDSGVNVLDMISDGFNERIAIHKRDGVPTIAERLDEILEKYPTLADKNQFIASLVKDEFNYRNATDILNFPASTDPGEIANVKAAFKELLEDKSGNNPELQQFAKDLVAYTVGTSGFSRNSHSFIMMIPPSFWSMSGIANLRRKANEDAKGRDPIENYSKDITGVVLRHIGPTTNLVKNVFVKKSQWDKTEDGRDYIKITIKNSAVIPGKDLNKALEFIKSYDPVSKTYQLYRKETSLHSPDVNMAYVPVSTFGEPNRSNEWFREGIFDSNTMESEVVKPDLQEDAIIAAYEREESAMPDEDYSPTLEDLEANMSPEAGLFDVAEETDPEPEKTIENMTTDEIFAAVKKIDPEYGLQEDYDDSADFDDAGNPVIPTDEQAAEIERNQAIRFLKENNYDSSQDDGLSESEMGDEIPPFALKESGIPTEMDQQVEDRLNNFLTNNGIDTVIVENMKERFGIDATGVADVANQAIYLAKGEEGRLSKPEEVAHIYIESTLGERQTEAMLAAVDGTEEYELVKEKYGKLYDHNDYKLRREAAAKILAKRLVEKTPAKNKLQRLMDKFMNFIKRKFGIMDPFTMGANVILEGTVLKPGQKKGGTMFKLDPGYDQDEISADQALDNANIEEMISSAQLEEMTEIKDPNDLLTKEEEALLQSSEGKKKIRHINEANLLLVISLKRQEKRLRREGKKSSSEEIKKLHSEILNLQGRSGMLKYMNHVSTRITEMTSTFNMLKEKNLLDNRVLMDMDTELKSFDNIRYVKQYFVDNSEQTAEEVAFKEELKEIFSGISLQRELLDTDISEQNIQVTGSIISALTSENLTPDQVVIQMNVAPKDVSFISKWIRPGADSADLLVRMTQKFINDAKQYAWSEFIDMYRGPLGLEQANDAYEKWLKKNGGLTSDMSKRNEPFIELVDGKWYLVNSEQGKAKYDALMALPATDPRRMYYDTLANMYSLAQQRIEDQGKKKPFNYQLPSVRKKTVEMMTGSPTDGEGNNLQRSFKELLKETLTVRPDDNEDGLVDKEKFDRDENNKIVKDVALYYTNKLDPGEVSLDIATSIGAATKNMLEYSRLSAIKAQLWSIEKIAKEREVAETSTSNSFIGLAKRKLNSLGQLATSEGDESNSYHQIQMIKDQHYYGMTNDKSVAFTIGGKEITWNKISDAISKISSSKIMILNPNIAISNALTGEMMMIQEAISGRYFDRDDWMKGAKRLKENYGQMVADIYSRKNNSKMGGLMELLNLSNNFETAHQKLGMKGSLKGGVYEGVTTSLRIMQTLGQTAIDIQTIGAMANNIKVQDAEGNDHTLYDAFDMVEGKMVMKEGYTYDGNALDNGDGTGEIYHLRERIIKVSENMHGIYNRLDAPALQAKVIGQQMMFMRGWLFSQLTRRFDTTRFQERLGEYDEGTYISMYHLLRNTFSENGPIGTGAKFKALFDMSPDENALSVEEQEKFKDNPVMRNRLIRARKANVKKAYTELVMIVGMYIFTSLAFDDEDEPGETTALYDFTRYHSLRLKREIFFYNPSEMLEIAKNPTINTSVLRDALGIAYSSLNFPSWGEEVASGSNKGDNKLWHKIRRNIPVINQIKALEDMSRAADAIEQGYR